MNTLNNVSKLASAVGLGVFAGSFIFGAGTLTILGWTVFAPLLAGSVGLASVSCYDLYQSFINRPKKVKSEVKVDEKKAPIVEGQPAPAMG